MQTQSITSKNKNHEFYINVTEYFKQLYPSISQDRLLLLKETAYGYFKFLLSLDNMADEGKFDFLVFFKRLSEFEECIKGLTLLFGIENQFWNAFNRHKEKYLHSYLLERNLSIQKAKIDEVVFKDLACGKSAMCLSIVDALTALSNESKYDNELKELINEVHIAFQYLDDLDDFKKDQTIGQRTFIISELEHILKERQIIINTQDPIAYKYLFLTDLAQKNIKNALQHFENAIRIARKLDLKLLIQYLLTEYKQCNERLIEISYILSKTKAKSEKSQSLINCENNINSAIELSLTYLKSEQEADGLFSDFLTTAGFGRIWVSAYTGCMLAESGVAGNIIALIKEYFVENKYASYNDNIFMDGDSASFVALFSHLTLIDYNPEKWLDFEDNGAWKTYVDSNPLQKLLHLPNSASVNGWISSKLCVSAAACYALKEMNVLTPVYNRTRINLIKSQFDDGHWPAYWWSSDIYATSFAVRSLSINDLVQIKLACKWLINEKKDQNDFWINPATSLPSPFYTALALSGLLRLKNIYSKEITEGIKWLLSQQYEDGSWASDHILRIPGPDVEYPSEIQKWKLGSFGTGVIVDDHNRIFTTATVVNLLVSFKTC